MDKKNEVKRKIKKVLWKMIQIPTIICVLTISGFICYYTKTFYKTNTLIFGIQDTKILLGLAIATIWSTWFSIVLMLEMNKKNNIIIQKNNTIIDQNETIKNLLSHVTNQNNTILEKSSDIEEQNDYIVEQADENYDQLIKFHKNTRQIFMDGSDKIA